MADTFGQAWRAVRAHVPMAPAMLCQQWVRDSYQEICDRAGLSWLRSESAFSTSAQKTAGTVAITRGATAVVGTGTSFAASDVDRQFRAGTNSPVYTVASFTDATHITLDRVYTGTTVTAATYSILDAYVTAPADFAKFITVIDPANGYALRHWTTEDELNRWDPQRSASGTAWALASRRYATTTALTGRIQYELWPYQTSAAEYPFYYFRQVETLADTTNFLGLLAGRGNIVVTGALAKAAEWPGVEGRRNPYFNLALAQNKRTEFQSEVDRLEVRDQEIYQTWLETVSWINRPSLAPIDARFMQEHGMSGQVDPWI